VPYLEAEPFRHLQVGESLTLQQPCLTCKNLFTSPPTYVIISSTNTYGKHVRHVRSQRFPERKRQRLKALQLTRNGYPSLACTCRSASIAHKGIRLDLVIGQ
jgi:hypothetical protein